LVTLALTYVPVVQSRMFDRISCPICDKKVSVVNNNSYYYCDGSNETCHFSYTVNEDKYVISLNNVFCIYWEKLPLIKVFSSQREKLIKTENRNFTLKEMIALDRAICLL
jgi:hypothetical protein